MGRGEAPRGYLVVIAAAVLGVLIAQIAVAGGGSAGPTATASGLKGQVKSLKKQVAALTLKVNSLQTQPGPQGPAGSPDTPQQVLDKLLQVDGSGSQLNADLLDNLSSAAFVQEAEFGTGDLNGAGSTFSNLQLGTGVVGASELESVGSSPDIGVPILLRHSGTSQAALVLPRGIQVIDVWTVNNTTTGAVGVSIREGPTCAGANVVASVVLTATGTGNLNRTQDISPSNADLSSGDAISFCPSGEDVSFFVLAAPE